MTRKNPLQPSRWKCTVAYDGTDFSGWQSQPHKNAIQDILERRLKEIFKIDVSIHGSGRTDSGVHAAAQVFHFDAVWIHHTDQLITAFRIGLPETIQVTSIQQVSMDFHARFNASGKVYRYQLDQGYADPFLSRFTWSVGRTLDVDAMKEIAALLVGEHDFRAFSAINGTARENTVRFLRRLDVTEKGRKINITAEADGFIYKMVRSLVGAVVAVGLGKITSIEVQRILRSKSRTASIKTAPPQGLCLMKVFYGAAGANPDES